MVAGVLLAGAAGVALLAVCWRRRTALGGVCAVVAIGLAAAAPWLGGAALAGAALAVVIGAVLLGLGQAVQRLLEEEADD
jgi:hypothetical protein